MNKVVMLSGVSGGMGLATAKLLSENGYTIYGLDIKKPIENILNLHFFEVDLRKMESIEDAFNKISKEVNNVDAIINMAGTYDLNSLIEMNEDEFLRIFDINVFAIYRLNKVFVPLLKEKGKVIMVSSELAALDPLPFTGIYAITKSTIEKYAYSLRMELQLLDKQVVVIRPGAVNTSLLDVSTTRLDNFTNNTKLYKYNATRFKDIVDKVEARKVDAIKIAELVNKILNKNKTRYVYKINRNPLLLILNALPQRTQNYIIKKILLKK